MNPEDKIIIDLDDTITIDLSSQKYESKQPNLSIKKALENISRRSIPITVFSARNMRSYEGDINKINQFTRPVAETWLKHNGIEYSELILGKPWSGKNGWYVDDKNLSLDEFIFKFSGPFAEKSFDIIIPFFNEEENIKKTYSQSKELEKLIDINSFIFINNGSLDNSAEVFEEIKLIDPKIKIITLNSNLGYGGGIKEGLNLSSSEFVLINHADGQFDAYNFIFSNRKYLPHEINSIMPQRLGRLPFEEFCSTVLRLIISLLTFRRVKDFNGQPKIFKISALKNISDLPNDYCIDYSLFKIFEDDCVFLPVIQRDRRQGSSSWNNKIFNWIKIFMSYLVFAVTFKKSLFRK